MSSKSPKMRDRSTSRLGQQPRGDAAVGLQPGLDDVERHRTGQPDRRAVGLDQVAGRPEVEDQPPQTLAQRGAGLVRAAVAPEPRRQPLAALDLVGLQRDIDQHRHRLAAGDRRLAAADQQPRGRAGGDGDRDGVLQHRGVTSHQRRRGPGAPRQRRACPAGQRPKTWDEDLGDREPAGGPGKVGRNHDSAPARQRGRECRELPPARPPGSRAAGPRTRRTTPAPARRGPAVPGRPADRTPRAGAVARHLERELHLQQLDQRAGSGSRDPRAPPSGRRRGRGRRRREDSAQTTGTPSADGEHEKSGRAAAPPPRRASGRARPRRSALPAASSLARPDAPRATSRRRVALDQLEERGQPRRREDRVPRRVRGSAAAPSARRSARARPPRKIAAAGTPSRRPPMTSVAATRSGAGSSGPGASMAGSPGARSGTGSAVCASTSAVSPARRAAAPARSRAAAADRQRRGRRRRDRRSPAPRRLAVATPSRAPSGRAMPPSRPLRARRGNAR